MTGQIITLSDFRRVDEMSPQYEALMGLTATVSKLRLSVSKYLKDAQRSEALHKLSARETASNLFEDHIAIMNEILDGLDKIRSADSRRENTAT